MNDLERRFLEVNPLSRWGTHPILAGVSGGADSTALLLLLHRFREEFGLRIFAAHANHQLRGAESEADEVFVTKLCRKLEIPLTNSRLEIERTSEGLETDARRARYEFLQKTAERLGCRYLALAHHRDDQAETILYRILRGTGVAGLAGMAPCRPLSFAVTIVRPLLSFSREEILNYLTELGQEWRTDSSNFCLKMKRNQIRQSLLPQLRSEFNPKLDEALVRLGSIAESMQAFVDMQTALLAAESLSVSEEGIQITPPVWENGRSTVPLCHSGMKLPESNHSKNSLDSRKIDLAQEFLWMELFRFIWRKWDLPQQEMGQKEWELLAQMILNPAETPRAHIFPGKIEAVRKENSILLKGFPAKKADFF